MGVSRVRRGSLLKGGEGVTDPDEQKQAKGKEVALQRYIMSTSNSMKGIRWIEWFDCSKNGLLGG